MSVADQAGLVAEPEASGVVGYQPETPFMVDGAALAPARPPGAPFAREAPTAATESPFVAEYGTAESVADARTEAFADLLGELEDHEFEEAVTDLVHEAAALAEDRFSFEGANPVAERIEAERGLRDYLEPLALECEAMVDRVSEAVGRADLGSMTEAELEEFLDRLAPGPTALPPVLDQFGGGFFKKIKKGIKGAVKLAKKGVSLAMKLSPTHLILGRLKKLVRPLLNRVLKFAINKLPVALRPIAGQLATRVLGGAPLPGVHPEAAMEDEGEATAEDPALIAHELDQKLAGYTLMGEDFDRQSAVDEFESEQGEGNADAWRELQQERAAFAQEVTGLGEGEDPAPSVERFVPAILAALRIGIKIIGRPKVVNFLAGLLAKLVVKYIGKAQAVPLSRALVDTGLRLVSLESMEQPGLEAGYALASTLEDTVTRVVQEAPAEAWESEAVLEAYVREAFQAAASAHFPDSMIRSELHEAAQSSGAWVALPGGTRRKHYKKYTRVLEVTITPQVARAVQTFGGTTLEAVLRDVLGLPAGQPVSARVHLYEALAGTTLPSIAFNEKRVPGLGSTRREAWSLLHPLTPEVAGTLLKEPGLGRAVDPRFLAHRGQVSVGQRFYFLEIAGSRPRLIAGARGQRRVARSTQVNVTLDFPRGEVRVALFFAEADAQAVSRQLRSRTPAAALLTALKSGLERRLSTLFSGVPTRRVRVVHEAVLTEQFRSPVLGAALRLVGRPLGRALLRSVLEGLKKELEQRGEPFAAQFTRAADAEADGVTVVLCFRQPGFLAPLRQVLAGGIGGAAAALSGALGRHGMSEYRLTIHPGFRRS